MAMTDDELATFLGIGAANERGAIMAKITPSERVLYDHMAAIEGELVLWEAGLGPKPAGVIICRRGRRGDR